MKRPLVILCLSDLHYLPETPGADALKGIKSATTNLESALVPDYIVVAGDIIVNKSTYNERQKGYKSVQELLDDLAKSYDIDKTKIIIAPGNHDKVCTLENEGEKKKVKRFFHKLFSLIQKEVGGGLKVKKYQSENMRIAELEEYCKSNDSNYDYEKNFGLQFQEFAEFYSNFIPDNNDYDNNNCVYFSPLSEDGNLSKTIGIKFFPEDQICFVTINTEITYTPENTGNANVMRLVPQLINKIIYQLSAAEYANYRVITVMHRNPNEFSFAEINKWSSLDYIYNWSDIILTGHNHPDRCQTPHLMANHAQLFKLGASSLNNRTCKEPTNYNALILNLDSSYNKLKYYYLKYSLDVRDSDWQIESENEVILAGNRYQSAYSNNQIGACGLCSIFANDSTDQSLQRSVKLFFGFKEDQSVFVRYVYGVSQDGDIKDICTNICKKVKEINQKGAGGTNSTISHLYVVFLYNTYTPETSLLKKIMEYNNVEQLKENIVQMKVVVIEALLKTPMLPYKKLEHEV